MTKKVFLFIILAGLGAITLFNNSKNQNINLSFKDFKDASYEIDDNIISLNSGLSESMIDGSSSKVVVRYFGNEIFGDFNNDGINDVAFLLTKNSGGSGTFFYVALAFGDKNGYIGANAVLLGDRIAPQTTEFKDGKIIVNYADRAYGEPMTATPSVGVSKYFTVKNNKLVKFNF